ncbi:MAG: hypothetical protein JNK33_03890 [Candidatus Doudnabacteria bacterium]|nr:hypothetical protein [Candidatus Doudnabacteria bacterium]
MDTFETNVAKIQIGNSKQTNTYVATMAERTPNPDSEIFAVVSLPVLNPAALDDCERIATSVTAALRRCYKRAINENSFEVALGEINDEVSKLSSLGQQTWTGKLSAVVAVRRGNHINVSATGKASALLMRAGGFNEITESTNAKHPLKTFENFSSGKLKIGDVIILTTAELFNHLSIDRLKNILADNTLEIGAQEVVRILEDNAGPEVAFATLLIQETEVMGAPADTLTLNEYQSTYTKASRLKQVTGFAQKFVTKEVAQNIWKSVKATASKRPNLNISKLSSAAASKGARGISSLKEHAQSYRQADFRAPLTKFQNFSKPKKFFTVSVAVLLLAVVVNIFVARNKRQSAADTAAFEQVKTSITKLVNDADSKLVFRDEQAALTLLQQAKQELSGVKATTADQKQVVTDITKQITTLLNKVEKITEVNPTTIATLSNADNLIRTPTALATATGTTIVSYNLVTGAIEDGALKTSTAIQDSAAFPGTSVVVFDGQGLGVWNTQNGTIGQQFYQNVPKAANFKGLVRYATNNRAYTADTALGQVISYLITNTSISKPVVSVKDEAIKNAQDIAVDGSVYVLMQDGIRKYTAGKPVAFTFPALSTPFSGTGKLFADNVAKQLYILDANGRIIITDKTGKLLQILASDQLEGSQDFTVDEAGKIIYVLRSGSLLKVNY